MSSGWNFFFLSIEKDKTLRHISKINNNSLTLLSNIEKYKDNLRLQRMHTNCYNVNMSCRLIRAWKRFKREIRLVNMSLWRDRQTYWIVHCKMRDDISLTMNWYYIYIYIYQWHCFLILETVVETFWWFTLFCYLWH